MTVTLDTINTAAADLISKAGWVQGTERTYDGRVCLTGALRYCRPQPGDDYLAREVYRRLGHGENWNDDARRTAEEVVAWLREHPVTNDLLAANYGPQWEAVVALVRRAAVLTDAEVTVLGTVRDGTWDATQDAARVAARAAARDADREAARNTAWYAAQNVAWEATQDAAIALAVRDLLLATPDGTSHYRALTRAWASTIGPVHPDDEPVVA